MSRAFRHRNYRLFFGGQTISLIGSWITRVATGWLVYKLTHSAFLLGAIGFAGQIPNFILAPFAGVLVDRWNRHRVLIVTQVLSMLQSAILAILTLMGIITVNEILILSLFQGCINSFDMPARQAFALEMVESRADLPNAIALNSSMPNVARLIGPSFAGVLIATVGEGGCFAIDALSYVAVIFSLWMMKLNPRKKINRPRGLILKELIEGGRYAIQFKSILYLLLILGLISLMGMPYMVLLPAVVKTRLEGGADLLGYLTAMAGVGALTGIVYLAARKSVVGLSKVVAKSSIIFGLGLVGFSFSKFAGLSMFFLFMIGMGMFVQLAAGNTILQTITEEDKRGRIMSLYTMSVMGMVPFGSLFSGFMAKYVGVSVTILVGGLTCIAGGLAFYRVLPSIRAEIRPIYQSLGILPKLPEEVVEAQ